MNTRRNNIDPERYIETTRHKTSNKNINKTFYSNDNIVEYYFKTGAYPQGHDNNIENFILIAHPLGVMSLFMFIS